MKRSGYIKRHAPLRQSKTRIEAKAGARLRRPVVREAIDTEELAFPKPGDKPREVGDAFRAYPDGRMVCNNAGKHRTAAGVALYRRLTELMWRRQGGLCCDCREPMRKCDVTFEHEAPRGSGGGSRDDRIYYRDEQGRMRRKNGAAHAWCNGARGSRRTLLWQPPYRKVRDWR